MSYLSQLVLISHHHRSTSCSFSQVSSHHLGGGGKPEGDLYWSNIVFKAVPMRQQFEMVIQAQPMASIQTFHHFWHKTYNHQLVTSMDEFQPRIGCLAKANFPGSDLQPAMTAYTGFNASHVPTPSKLWDVHPVSQAQVCHWLRGSNRVSMLTADG